jgi:signal transduction histidine kinase
VIINLIQNALESMPQGGSLNINTKVSIDGQYPDKNIKKIIEIKISDTGNGMDKVQMQNIFEPFYTTKRGGLGLGLTICKEIIEQHKGIINVESQKDRGTIFTIRLPV